MMVDSLEMTDQDRRIILDNCRHCPQQRILLTHGTDTMVETAHKLSGIRGKTIVMTGALKPALFKTTDAVFNIGGAVAAVQAMNPGVYIVMNGCSFPHDRVRKNVQLGKFEAVE